MDDTEKNVNSVVVSVKHVSKKFCKNLKRSMAYGIMDLSRNLFNITNDSGRLRRDEFWALDDINFELSRGESLGLIGVNGSGKTTLLRLLSGIFPPDKGEIAVRGRVGALIAVGAGFHPHMTGRENIYLNGAILGMTRKEIDSKFRYIVDFAGINGFLDAPVSMYSSGMRVRLGFSIATAVDPDILLLDEILAVGDARFRNKCYYRIGEIRKNAAIIFVSHSVDQIARICDRCLLLNRGKAEYFGEVSEAIKMYVGETEANGGDSVGFEKVFEPVKSVRFDWSTLTVEYGETVQLVMTVVAEEAIPDNMLRIVLYDHKESVVAEWNNRRMNQRIDLNKGTTTLRVNLGPLHLKNGEYRFGVVLNDAHGTREIIRTFRQYALHIDGPVQGSSAYQLPSL